MPRSTKVVNNLENTNDFPLDEVDTAFNFLIKAMLRRYGISETVHRVGKIVEEEAKPI